MLASGNGSVKNNKIRLDFPEEILGALYANALIKEGDAVDPKECATYVTAAAQRALVVGDRGAQGNRVDQLVKVARFCAEESGLDDAAKLSFQRRLQSIETAANRYAKVECEEGKAAGILGESCAFAAEIVSDVFGETRAQLGARMAWNMVDPGVTDLYAAELLHLTAERIAKELGNETLAVQLEERMKMFRNALVPNAISEAAVNGEMYAFAGETSLAKGELDRIDEVLAFLSQKGNPASVLYRQFYNDAHLAKGNIALRLADHYFSASLASEAEFPHQGMSTWGEGTDWYTQAGAWIGPNANFAESFAKVNRKMGEALEHVHQSRILALSTAVRRHVALTESGLRIDDARRFERGIRSLGTAFRAAKKVGVQNIFGEEGKLLEQSVAYFEKGNRIAFESTFARYLLAGMVTRHPGAPVASLNN